MTGPGGVGPPNDLGPSGLLAPPPPAAVDTPAIDRSALLDIIGYAARRTRAAALVWDDAVVAELAGHRAKTTLARMALDPVISGIVERMRLVMRSAIWTLRPGGPDDLDKEFRDFVADSMEKLEGGFQAVIGNSATKIVWGFSLFEQLFERTPGGDYRWVAFVPRAQETVWDWDIEPHTGRLKTVIQQTDDGYHAVIPAWKLLHFRTEPLAGRPEGRPLVRNAYLAWVDKQELRRIVKIGVRRDLVGTPIATVPPELMSDQATDEEKAVLAQVTKLMQEIENDERQYVIFPNGTDKQGNATGWSFDLIKSPGTRQLRLEDIWHIFDQQIAIGLMGETVLLGTQNVGSFALADIKTSTIAKAASAWLDDDAEFMRTKACRTLQLLNPRFAGAKPPIWDHSPLDPMSLDDLSNFVSRLGTGGFITPDPNLEAELRRRAELPVLIAEGDQIPANEPADLNAPVPDPNAPPQPAKPAPKPSGSAAAAAAAGSTAEQEL